MSLREITMYVIGFIILAIFAYDGYAYITAGQEATISSVIITDWSKRYPAFTFLIGFIMGHLFWPLTPKDDLK